MQSPTIRQDGAGREPHTVLRVRFRQFAAVRFDPTSIDAAAALPGRFRALPHSSARAPLRPRAGALSVHFVRFWALCGSFHRIVAALSRPA